MKKLLVSLVCICIILTSVLTLVNAEPLQFEDVKESHWFYADVAKVWELGIMDGKSPTIFAPKTVMTRAEFVTLLSRIADVDLDGMSEYASEKFTDIKPNDWYSSYVGWGASVGIVTGYTNGTFLPNNPVSRQELAVMIVRFMDFQGLKITADNSLIDSFADQKSIGSWAREQVEFLRITGLVGGDENGNFNSKKNATRAEVAAIAGRYYDVVSEYFSDFAPETLTLELTVTFDALVTEDDLAALLASSVDNYDTFSSVSFEDLADLVVKLNALGEEVCNVDVQITFTRGEVSSTGSYTLIFTRESAPVEDPIPTPEHFDEAI